MGLAKEYTADYIKGLDLSITGWPHGYIARSFLYVLNLFFQVEPGLQNI